METFNDHLYVGSALWFDYYPPFPGAEELAKGPKGFELIRIDTDDNAELIIGDYNPLIRDPWPPIPREPPMSGWPAGFGNILQPYCWSLEEYCGWLILGTLDLSSFLGAIPPELIDSLLDPDALSLLIEELQIYCTQLEDRYLDELLALLEGSDLDLAEIIGLLWQYLGGADMWMSCDGIHWIPVSLNGFDNPYNYGFRTMCSTPDGLYVGTANPFLGQGCEVWVATGVCRPCMHAPVGGVWVPINKFELLAPWIGLASLITAAAVSVGYVRRRKKK